MPKGRSAFKTMSVRYARTRVITRTQPKKSASVNTRSKCLGSVEKDGIKGGVPWSSHCSICLNVLHPTGRASMTCVLTMFVRSHRMVPCTSSQLSVTRGMCSACTRTIPSHSMNEVNMLSSSILISCLASSS